MAFILYFSMIFLVISGGQAQSSSPPPPSTTFSSVGSSPSSGSSDDSNPVTPWDDASSLESSSSNSTASLNTTEPDNSDYDDVGIDEGDDGVADDLADYIVKKIGDLIHGGDEADVAVVETVEDQKNLTDDPTLKNCSQEATLDRYCEEVPEDVHAYFNYDVSVEGLLRSMFDQTVVDALQANCAPGSWCLPDEFHTDILRGQDDFYIKSPFCSDAMWTCLETMVNLRYDCSEEPLSYLVDIVLLLCNMEAVGDLGPECYARTVEALYVSYADSTRTNGSHKADLEKDDCNDFKMQITRTYLCADDVCGFDQDLLLEKFSAWAGVADKAVGVVETCNISRECQNDYDDDYDSYYDYYYDDDAYDEEEEDEDYEDYKEELQEIEEEIQKELADEDAGVTGTGSQDGYNSYYEDDEVNADTGDSYEDGDRAMLFGLITMTTVLTLGLLSIAFVGFRRYRRTRFANYRRGYSQLADEEAKMLRGEYK